jgi:hypothetical protein
MKLTISTIILLSISLLVILFSVSSCDDDAEPYEDSETIDCFYCYDEIPEYVDMELQFNMALNTERVYYTVYSGFAFSSEIYMEGEAVVNSLWIQVLPDTKYTIVAEYNRGGRNIKVINDCKVKTEYFEYACDTPCHYVYEANCDLKLKSVY